jgi:hypothetical protein
MQRFTISVDDQWTVQISDSNEAAIGVPRPLRRTQPSDDGHTYPLPPDSDLPPADAAHYPLCTDEDTGLLSDVAERISDRLPQPGDLVNFGRYLFQTLIGTANLQAVEGAAGNAKLIELALSWGAAQRDLNRLNWELMCRPQDPANPAFPGFLADGNPRPIGITRLVATAQSPARPISAPPRILFILGTAFTDPDIRPGAEYLGLMRQFRKNQRTVHTRVLQQAKPKKLKQVMGEFRPDVVHFICHGFADEHGGYLELQTDDSAADSRRYAAHILTDLKYDNRYPAMVLLSACYSGNILGPGATGSLAAELVAGGIPIVVGMAGRISDLACRLFTQRFADSLVQGDSLVYATSEGRCAALYEGLPAQSSADWAFPTLYMSTAVPPEYRPYEIQGDDPCIAVENRIKSYNLDDEPVFCARHEFLEAYYDLMNPDSDRNCLAIYTHSPELGIGRTRLLQEFTAQAVRDGHVPCLMTDIPDNTNEFMVKLVDALNKARDACEVDVLPDDSQLILLCTEDIDTLKNHASLNDAIRRDLKLKNTLTARAISTAIQIDCEDSLQAVYDAQPTIKGRMGHLLILLDEVHDYGEELTTLLTGKNDSLLTAFGFGSQKMTIPVIMTFSQSGPAAHVLKPNIIENQKSWIDALPIECFRELNDEDLLAYYQLFLHPYCYNPEPKTVNSQADSELVSKWVSRLRKKLKGRPGQFVNQDIIETIIEWATDDKFLIVADDEAVLQRLRGI